VTTCDENAITLPPKPIQASMRCLDSWQRKAISTKQRTVSTNSTTPLLRFPPCQPPLLLLPWNCLQQQWSRRLRGRRRRRQPTPRGTPRAPISATRTSGEKRLRYFCQRPPPISMTTTSANIRFRTGLLCFNCGGHLQHRRRCLRRHRTIALEAATVAGAGIGRTSQK
jgi:hypothetical protein